MNSLCLVNQPVVSDPHQSKKFTFMRLCLSPFEPGFGGACQSLEQKVEVPFFRIFFFFFFFFFFFSFIFLQL